ncbi:NUDIX domain-containing protein [Streptomyces achromogenes]
MRPVRLAFHRTGAALVRPDGRVLTIEHRALRKWLLPGGHVEAEDTSLRDAALRELAEETNQSTRTSTSGSCSAPPPTRSNCKRERSRTTRGSSPTCSRPSPCAPA